MFEVWGPLTIHLLKNRVWKGIIPQQSPKSAGLGSGYANRNSTSSRSCVYNLYDVYLQTDEPLFITSIARLIIVTDMPTTVVLLDNQRFGYRNCENAFSLYTTTEDYVQTMNIYCSKRIFFS